MDIKAQILKEFFNIGGNIDFVALSSAKEKILNYLETTKDAQLEDVLRIIKLYEADFEVLHNFEESGAIVAPIFERLKNDATWDIYDMRIMASVVKHAESCKRSCELVEIILKRAEEFENQGIGDFLRTKFAVCANITGRLLNEKYERAEDWSDKEIKELFLKYADLAARFSDKGDFGGFPNLLEVRRGLFLKNFDIIEDHLAVLERLENRWYFRYATDEVNLCKSYINFPIGKKEFRTKIGKRVKEERQRLDLSRISVGEELGVTDTQIRFIETGIKGTTSFNLYKLSKLLGVSVDYLLEAVDELEPGQERKISIKEEEFRKWLTIASTLTDEELVFVTDTLKNIEKLRKK